MKPRIHLVAPAGSCRSFLAAIGARSAADLITVVQQAVGEAYLVTGNESLIDADEGPEFGGRADDSARAEDLVEAFESDQVAAVVALRGGAWLTRMLPRIDLAALDRRSRPVALFGFSELTSLVNIVGACRQGIGIYDMGPAFLTYGLRRFASLHDREVSPAERRTEAWVQDRLRPEFDGFFRDVIAMIEGKGTQRPLTARLARGTLPDRCEATVVGGNLTVCSALIGTRFEGSINPAGRWLLLEEFRDELGRIDRLLAHLTLAGYWETCEGLLLGDFHKGYDDQTQSVLDLLPYHIPPSRRMPVLVTPLIGHVWPMAPLPLHTPLVIERRDEANFGISWPATALRTV